MNKQFEQIAKYHCLRWNELPDLALYMDQVLTILDKQLSPLMCDSEDKNLTSTMINNYVKHKVIPAPVKKKYEKEHLANLTIVCIAKQILSLSEIQSMMQQLCVLGSIEQIYDDFCAVLENRLGSMFGTKTCEKNLQTETQSILDALVGAFVNKLYLQRLIQDAEQLDMKKAD